MLIIVSSHFFVIVVFSIRIFWCVTGAVLTLYIVPFILALFIVCYKKRVPFFDLISTILAGFITWKFRTYVSCCFWFVVVVWKFCRILHICFDVVVNFLCNGDFSIVTRSCFWNVTSYYLRRDFCVYLWQDITNIALHLQSNGLLVLT